MSSSLLMRCTAVAGAVAAGGFCIAVAPSHAQPGPDPPTVGLRLLSTLPLAALSRAGAAVSAIPIPTSLRSSIYSAYSREPAEEAELELSEYRSFADFFARKLRSDARFVDPRADIVSPVDGTVVAAGVVRDGGVLPGKVKGVEFTARQLLNAGDHDPLTHSADAESAARTDLYAVVLSLSPRDCHQFKSPANFRITEKRHVAGGRYWLDTPVVDGGAPGYVRNERVALVGAWTGGMCSLTAVGAPGIGTIELEREVLGAESNVCDVLLRPGDGLGGFRLGSAVVLVFEAPAGGFKFEVEPDSRIRAGEAVGQLLSPSLLSPMNPAVSGANSKQRKKPEATGVRTRRSW